jgi:hypothetical protein
MAHRARDPDRGQARKGEGAERTGEALRLCGALGASELA